MEEADSDKNASKKAIFLADGPVYKTDIKNVLASIDIQKGDAVVLHSDLSVFGGIGDIRDRNTFLDEIINCFKEIVGAEGTLIVPSFTYSFLCGETFDKENSPSKVGVLSERFRQHPDIMRTPHPTHSFLVWGKRKDELSGIPRSYSFGEGSIFQLLDEIECKIVFFGAKFQSCTQVHYMEELTGVPNRKWKRMNGKMIAGCKETELSYDYYSPTKSFSLSHAYDFSKLESILEKKKLLLNATLGYGQVKVIGSRQLGEQVQELLKKDKKGLYRLKDKGESMDLIKKGKNLIVSKITGK